MFSSLVTLFLGAVPILGWNPPYTQEALGDAITNLPGLPSNANYTMFGGYITVDESHNRSLFYWFIESLNDPANDPVAFWTNGGPGCSGLLGLMTENGPFWISDVEGELYINDFSWVNVANMLYIEQPAGIGFSFSDVPSDYITGDDKAATDNYNFIRLWLDRFDQYKTNPFYITSESYGGHYMPTLAREIVLGNKNGGNPQINFKGVFVGNPYTDPYENKIGAYGTYGGHSLVPRPMYLEWVNQCDNGRTNSVKCSELENSMSNAIGDLDPYALDFPVCTLTTNQQKVKGIGATNHMEKFWFLNHLHEATGRPVPPFYKKLFGNENGFGYKDKYIPCAENLEDEYLSRPDVQEAIHAKRDAIWTGCSTVVRYNFSDSNNPMEPIWQWLTDNAPDLRKTVVSGDDDSVCGSLGTQSWMFGMGWDYSAYDWQAWMYDEQVAGYLTKFYNGSIHAMNLVTVHTAGHMVPQTQPARSLQAFTNFLNGVF